MSLDLEREKSHHLALRCIVRSTAVGSHRVVGDYESPVYQARVKINIQRPFIIVKCRYRKRVSPIIRMGTPTATDDGQTGIKFRTAVNDLLIGMDANQDVRTGSLARMMKSMGLHDPILDKHGSEASCSYVLVGVHADK